MSKIYRFLLLIFISVSILCCGNRQSDSNNQVDNYKLEELNVTFSDSMELKRIEDFVVYYFKDTLKSVSDYIFLIENVDKFSIKGITCEQFDGEYHPLEFYKDVKQFDENDLLKNLIIHVWMIDNKNFTTSRLIKCIKLLEISDINENIYFICLNYCLYYFYNFHYITTKSILID